MVVATTRRPRTRLYYLGTSAKATLETDLETQRLCVALMVDCIGAQLVSFQLAARLTDSTLTLGSIELRVLIPRILSSPLCSLAIGVEPQNDANPSTGSPGVFRVLGLQRGDRSQLTIY